MLICLSTIGIGWNWGSAGALPIKISYGVKYHHTNFLSSCTYTVYYLLHFLSGRHAVSVWTAKLNDVFICNTTMCCRAHDQQQQHVWSYGGYSGKGSV